MKNYVIILFLLITTQAFSQIISPNGKNLFYYNGSADVTFRFADRGTGGRAFVHGDGNVLTLNYGGDFTGGVRIGSSILFLPNGNVGIGNAEALAPLSIGTNHGVKLAIGNSGWVSTSIIETGWSSQLGDYTDLKVAGGSRNTALLRFTSGGKLGVGTANPAYTLDVIGTIRANEIKVDLKGADFVFDNDYKLMSLIELEKFIKEQKHLPEVAPAKEMKENGTNLGNLNSMLLQKMEEMTLYIIEQNKKIEKLEKEMIEIKKK